MDTNRDDYELICDFSKTHSEEAFQELVARHVNHVYSAALRQVSHHHLAQEVTQSVFIVLARKAGTLRPDTILSAWLFQVTRFACRDALKKEFRRQKYEQEVANMTPQFESPDEESWQEISPMLDEAIASLAEPDRNILLLRFFEKRNHKEIAGTMGIKEVAAKKRLSRAVDRLRDVLQRRGVTVSSIALGVMLSTSTVLASPSLIIPSLAAISQGGAASLIADGTVRMMTLTKINTLAGVSLVTLVILGTPLFIHHKSADWSRLKSYSLPDGSKIEIRDISARNSYDYTHVSGPLWKRTLGRVLPTGLVTRWNLAPARGNISFGLHPGNTNLFVTVVQTHPEGLIKNELALVQVVTADGWTYDARFNSGSLYDPSEIVTIWNIHAFPRRDDFYRLRFLYSVNGASEPDLKTAFEVKVANTFLSNQLGWKPDPLPVTREEGPLKVSLLGFDSTPHANWEQHKKSQDWSHLHFRVKDLIAAGSSWSALMLTFSDPTGNRWNAPDFQTEKGAPGELHLYLPGKLWPSEPGWKLDLQMARSSGFYAHELGDFTIEIPATEELRGEEDLTVLGTAMTPLPVAGEKIEQQVNGTILKVRGVAGSNASLPDPYSSNEVPGKVKILLRQSNFSKNTNKRVLILGARDDTGRPVQVEHGFDAEESWFTMATEPDARKVQIRFAVPECRTVQFMSRPDAPRQSRGKPDQTLN